MKIPNETKCNLESYSAARHKILKTYLKFSHSLSGHYTSLNLDYIVIRPIRKLKNILWVLGVGESEPKARPMKEEWALDISERSRLLAGKDQCKETEVPFFFSRRDGKPKQWKGKNKKKADKLLKGKTWYELPILKTE